ncbi:MAG: FixH family protein [Xanthomonadales bacterium]|nr:FixH family protein [Xanthomonadales bacterium]
MTNINKQQLDTEPWYKQFWPWFIMALPMAAVIASISTLVIAIKNPDYLVIKKSEQQSISAEMRPAKKTGLSTASPKPEQPD